MNYQRIYNQIIERAKSENRQKNSGIYYEAHHIIPVCLGGQGKYSIRISHPNIVLLTAREHFLCHWLLHEIYPLNRKLALAFSMMCIVKDKIQERYIPSSRIIEYAKLKSIEYKKTVLITEETKKKISSSVSGIKNGFYQKKHSEESKMLMKKPRPTICGNKNPSKRDDVKNKISLKNKGRKLEKMTGIKHPFSKQVEQYSLAGDLIKTWESINLARLGTGASSSGIRLCCNQKRKSSGGYIWKWKN